MNAGPAIMLALLAVCLLLAAWAVADLLVHPPSSLIRRAVRYARHYRYARAWGLPMEAFAPDAQARTAAVLRQHAIRLRGVTDEEWRDFVDAHQTTAGGVS